MEQFYKIAGLTVKMDTFGRTQKLAQPYLCPEGPVDLEIRSDMEKVRAKNPGMSDDHCEYLASGGSFYEQLLDFEGMLLHAAAVVVDGKAYLFTAPRKTGKSTHVQLWLDTFGDSALILNEDKPALRRVDGKWYAFGTPWSGKTGRNTNLQVSIGGIAILQRAEENSIVPIPGSMALYQLLEQTVRPKDPAGSIQLLELMDSLLSQVQVWKLHCNMDRSAAQVAYEALSGQKI